MFFTLNSKLGQILTEVEQWEETVCWLVGPQYLAHPQEPMCCQVLWSDPLNSRHLQGIQKYSQGYIKKFSTSSCLFENRKLQRKHTQDTFFYRLSNQGAARFPSGGSTNGSEHTSLACERSRCTTGLELCGVNGAATQGGWGWAAKWNSNKDFCFSGNTECTSRLRMIEYSDKIFVKFCWAKMFSNKKYIRYHEWPLVACPTPQSKKKHRAQDAPFLSRIFLQRIQNWGGTARSSGISLGRIKG